MKRGPFFQEGNYCPNIYSKSLPKWVPGTDLSFHRSTLKMVSNISRYGYSPWMWFLFTFRGNLNSQCSEKVNSNAPELWSVLFLHEVMHLAKGLNCQKKQKKNKLILPAWSPFKKNIYINTFENLNALSKGYPAILCSFLLHLHVLWLIISFYQLNNN